METTTKQWESSQTIAQLRQDNLELKSKLRKAEDDLHFLNEELQECESKKVFTNSNTPYENLRGDMVLEKLFSNLSYIPINALESLVEKYAVVWTN